MQNETQIDAALSRYDIRYKPSHTTVSFRLRILRGVSEAHARDVAHELAHAELQEPGVEITLWRAGQNGDRLVETWTHETLQQCEMRAIVGRAAGLYCGGTIREDEYIVTWGSRVRAESYEAAAMLALRMLRWVREARFDMLRSDDRFSRSVNVPASSAPRELRLFRVDREDDKGGHDISYRLIEEEAQHLATEWGGLLHTEDVMLQPLVLHLPSCFADVSDAEVLALIEHDFSRFAAGQSGSV